MSEQEQPVANVKEVKTVSKIWFLPIVALFVGAWMVYYEISNKGHEIVVYFSSAEGLEAGKTKIKTRYVDVGMVTGIKLRKNQPGVEVTARVDQEAHHLLRKDTNLWIVAPRVSISGVSGLSTILSGPFIELSPGTSDDEQYVFDGLEDPPVTPAGTPGLHITLNSDDEFAYKKGDPIVYKGIQVGRFEHIHFNLEERVVYYDAFIEAPYHRLITANTRFWDTSGVRFDLGAEGLTIQTGSLETLLTNGVTFGIPPGMNNGPVITERAYFDIHKSFEQASANRFIHEAHFIILIEDSVRGLRVGAPVEYRGLQVGKVLDINIEEDKTDQVMVEGHKIPIRIAIQPGRVKLPDTAEGVAIVNEQIKVWVERGMRATLEVGNIVTGGQYVDLQNYDDMGAIEMSFAFGLPVIPTISNEFAQLTQKVNAILNQINALPFEELTDTVNTTLKEFASTAETFNQTGQNLNELLVDSQQQQLIKELSDTISAFEVLAQSYSGQSETNRTLNELLVEVQSVLLEMKPILNRVNESPTSLVIPVDEVKQEIIPRAKGN